MNSISRQRVALVSLKERLKSQSAQAVSTKCDIMDEMERAVFRLCAATDVALSTALSELKAIEEREKCITSGLICPSTNQLSEKSDIATVKGELDKLRVSKSDPMSSSSIREF